MALGTTTRKRRNIPQLERTREAAKELGLINPIIINYGPGGVINFLINHLPEEKKIYQNKIIKYQKGLIKLAESVLRKTNLFSLETSEPKEIIYTLQHLSPKIMYVVDKERKVIAAVEKMVKQNKFLFPIKSYNLDIQEYQFEQQGDIVIAYNIVQRTNNPVKALNHIANTTNIGGLLSVNIPIVPEGFKEIDKEIYLRIY